ncbi:alcohol dehydrogenase catalytic domain-containing protein, partial [Streptomyces sp. NPDC002491]
MLACVIHGQGDLRVDELTAPSPGPGEVLVAVSHGGICGSDLHYWRHGGVGDFRLRAPMVLGHEVVGVASSGPLAGAAVAVHPATPCGVCPECAHGRRQVCRDTR